MRKLFLPFIAIMIVISFANGSCKSRADKQKDKLKAEYLRGAFNQRSNLPFDSNLLISFYRSYPELKKYQKDVSEIYRRHKYMHIWYDEQGVVEFGYTLFSKARELNGAQQRRQCVLQSILQVV